MDVVDLGRAVASGNPVDIAISVVGFVPGGDILKAARKLGKVADKAKSIATAVRKKVGKRVCSECVGGGCFVEGTPVASGSGPSSRSVPIETVRVGDRVLTAKGGSSSRAPDDRAVFSLRLRQGEAVADIELLRPRAWGPEEGEGGRVWLDLAELGAEGWAEVLAIRASEVAPGVGRLVTGTFERLSDDVYEVRFSEEAAVLRGTGSHPLYSLDRDAWVQVRELRLGERLQTAESAVRVEALEKVRGVHRVYNLEVEGDHEYLVGDAWVRAHNNGCGKVAVAKSSTHPDAVALSKKLASQQQLSELQNGVFQVMAGKGGRTRIRDEARLVAEYGGKSGDWQKIRSSNHKPADGSPSFETHAYRNAETGQIVEPKTKFQ